MIPNSVSPRKRLVAMVFDLLLEKEKREALMTSILRDPKSGILMRTTSKGKILDKTWVAIMDS